MRVAAIYFVIETVKLYDIESLGYIDDVIETIASGWRRAGMSSCPGTGRPTPCPSAWPRPSPTCVSLLPIAFPIWPGVEVPIDASLKMVHDVILGAMGWLDYHLWEFEAGDRRYGLPDPDWPDDSLFAAKNTKLKTQAFASSSIPVT